MDTAEITIESQIEENDQRKNIRPIIALLLIMLFAVTIRFVSWNLIDLLYRDSVNFIVNAEKFSADSLRDTKQEPMHLLAIIAIHKVLFPRAITSNNGIIDQPEWELAIFTLGLVCTLICLWLLYAIGSHIHSPPAGLWAALFLAIMPYGVAYSINGLSELPFLAMLLLSVYLVMKSLSLNAHSKKLIFIAGISAALLVLTRKEGFILLPVVILYLLCAGKIIFTKKLKLIVIFLASSALLFLAYYLIGGRFYWADDYYNILQKLYKKRFGGQAWIGGSNYILALHWFKQKYEYYTLPIAGWFKLGGFAPAILFLIFLTRCRKIKFSPGIWLLISFAFFYTIMVIIQNIIVGYFVTRYLVPMCVILFPIAGLMLTEIFTAINLKYNKPAADLKIGLIFALIMTMILSVETIQNCYSSRKPQITMAANWIDQNIPKNAFIFTTDERIGFYSKRAFKSSPLYNIRFHIADLSKDETNTYLVVDAKKSEFGHIESELKKIKDKDDLASEFMKDFTVGKRTVTVYKLPNK